MSVEDEVGWHSIVVADKSRIRDTEAVPTAVPDPPQPGGIKAALETDSLKPTQNSSSMARKATERVSAERSAPIWINLDPGKPNRETGRACTMPKDPEPGKPEKGQPF